MLYFSPPLKIYFLFWRLLYKIFRKINKGHLLKLFVLFKLNLDEILNKYKKKKINCLNFLQFGSCLVSFRLRNHSCWIESSFNIRRIFFSFYATSLFCLSPFHKLQMIFKYVRKFSQFIPLKKLLPILDRASLLIC